MTQQRNDRRLFVVFEIYNKIDNTTEDEKALILVILDILKTHPKTSFWSMYIVQLPSITTDNRCFLPEKENKGKLTFLSFASNRGGKKKKIEREEFVYYSVRFLVLWRIEP